MYLLGLDDVAEELMFSHGFPATTRITPDIVQRDERDEAWTRLEYDFDDVTRNALLELRHAPVPIGYLPSIIDQVRKQDTWQAVYQDILQGTEWETHDTWMDYGTVNSDTVLVAASGRDETGSDILPYRFERVITEVPLQRELPDHRYMTYLETLPQIDYGIERLLGVLHHLKAVGYDSDSVVSREGVTEPVLVDGAFPCTTDDEYEVLRTMEYCRGGATIGELESVLTAVMEEDAYREAARYAVDQGLDQYTMTVDRLRGQEDAYELTLSFSCFEDDVERSVILSTEPHLV